MKGAGHTSVAFNAPAGASRGVAIDDVTIGDPSVAQPTSLASYEWDSLGRLRRQTTPDGSRSWTYANGRLEQMSQDLPGATGTTVLEHDDGSRDRVELKHTLTDEHIAWFWAGSALNILAQNG